MLLCFSRKTQPPPCMCFQALSHLLTCDSTSNVPSTICTSMVSSNVTWSVTVHRNACNDPVSLCGYSCIMFALIIGPFECSYLSVMTGLSSQNEPESGVMIIGSIAYINTLVSLSYSLLVQYVCLSLASLPLWLCIHTHSSPFTVITYWSKQIRITAQSASKTAVMLLIVQIYMSTNKQSLFLWFYTWGYVNWMLWQLGKILCYLWSLQFHLTVSQMSFSLLSLP